jgi:cell division protein FtsA
MSNYKELVSAVDIGSSNTTAIIGRFASGNKLEILGYGCVETDGVRNGVVVNIEEAGKSVRAAIDTAEKGLNLKVKKVYAGISGQKIKSVTVDGYRMIDREGEVTTRLIKSLYDEMHRYSLEAGEQILHVLPQEFLVDGEGGIKQPVGMTGNRIDAKFNLVIGPVSYRNNLQRCLEKAGLELVKVFANPYVQGTAFLTNDEKEAGVVLLDFGSGTTGVTVYYENRLQNLAELPFGGSVVTNDIKEGCNIIARHAEMLKVKFGSAMEELAPENKVVQIPEVDGWPAKEVSFRSLSSIIQARVEEILEGVNYQVEKTGLLHKLGAGVVVTGGGAKMKDVDKLVSYMTGLDVRYGKPVIPMEQHLFNDQIMTPASANVTGLLVEGLKERQGIKSPAAMVTADKGSMARRTHKTVVDQGPGLMNAMGNLFEKAKEGFGSLIADEDMEME